MYELCEAVGESCGQEDGSGFALNALPSSKLMMMCVTCWRFVAGCERAGWIVGGRKTCGKVSPVNRRVLELEAESALAGWVR